MKEIDVAQATTIIANLGVIGGLIFVGLQIRLDQEIAIVDTHGSINVSTMALADLVERNSEVWSKGLEGEELSNNDKMKFLAIATAAEMHLSNAWVRASRIGPVPRQVVARGYAYALYIYPGLRKALNDKAEVYRVSGRAMILSDTASTAFTRTARQYLMELDEAGTIIPPEKAYVYW